MRWNSSTVWIILVYIAFGSLWIILSDGLLGLVARDSAQLVQWQQYKGIAFIAATALLLYGLLSYRQRQLARSEARQRLFIKHAPAALAMLDTELRFMLVSDRWLKDYGLSGENLSGRGHYEVFPEIPQRWREIHQRALRGEVLRAECDYFIRPDGRTQWQRWEVRPWYLEDQSIGGILIFTEDITQQKEAEREMRIAAKAFETRQAMIITDDAQRILRVNRAFCETTGYQPDEVIGQTPTLLKSGRHDADFYRALWQQLNQHGEWQGEIWNRRKNGQIFPEWLHISSVVDDQGRVIHYIGAFDDMSEHKQAEAQIHSLSYFDVLTKLPNRRLFIDRLQQALLGSARSRHRGAVFFIDLDDFSALNDTQGHDVGDQVLIEVSRQLLAAVASDDTVARLGSDEFVVVIEHLDSRSDAALLQANRAGERLLAAIRQPIRIDGSDFVITGSMGISLFDGATDKVSDLFKRADAAMVQVKQIGRNCLHFFDQDMQLALEQRVELEALLRNAIPEQLRLHYQPQLDAQGQLVGAEVLVRWQDPHKGLISPAQFIPLAEASGLILPMGQWILHSACEQLARWQQEPLLQQLSLSVNVSPKQFQQANFVNQVLEALSATGADPTRLKLEITESLLFNDLERVTKTMTELKSHGIRISLDDFGTGFSSLSYLKQLPVDELKIDQSFVRSLETDDSDAAIVRTIITLGQSLGVEVIAEGVETGIARDLLIAQGCHRFQGFYFAKPMPLKELERWWSQAGQQPRPA
ncbi:MAG: EAL domain-containing protein [Chromatiaceae bacterium]|nr:EAL domain-containing protein [Chromatiaceae bacterium]